jgi:hypothetical protein
MATYQDGTFPSGAPTLTINGVTYKCNSFAVSKAAETVNITDENGAHSGALSFAGPVTGTAEVQFAANTTAEPTTAAANSTTGVFAATLNNVSTNCFITAVTVNKPQRGPWTAALTWQAKQN